MKIRTDFVTNSSSTSYMVIAISDTIQEKILKIEGIDPNKTNPWDMEFSANNLQAISDGWDDIRWIGWSLSERDLRYKTLNELEDALVEELNDAYNLGITANDLYFDMDTIHD